MFQDRLENYKWLESNLGSKLLIYVTGDRIGMETQIQTDVLDYFADHLDKIGKVEKISLLLYTRGGDTMAAWSLVNLIWQFCNTFEVIVPSKARSSGTIICLGADSIIMTKQATLGPIDPSLNSPLNPQNPQQPNNPMSRVQVSVESIQGFFELAKQELGLQPENLKEVLLSLNEKVHPLVLGNIYRSRTQIQMVAKKLLKKQLPGEDQAEKINKIISFLCSDSGSHDYAIYRDEAKDELGLNVVKPNEEQYNKIKLIFEDIRSELNLMKPFRPEWEIGQTATSPFICRRGLVESVDGGTDVFITQGSLSRVAAPPPNPAQGIAAQLTFEGWKHE